MAESTGSMPGWSMPEWVTSTVSRIFSKLFKTSQSSGSTRHLVMIRTWLVRPFSSSSRSVRNVCGLTTGSMGSVARLKIWIGVRWGRKYLCPVSSSTAASSLISRRGVLSSKLSNRWRTQYPQSSGQPTMWLSDSPDLRYSTTSASSGLSEAICALVSSGSRRRPLMAVVIGGPP
ncbi:hypothetical protein [Streptomyces sp. NRRL S-350]|uniref:hypothetical protein n=1 Tax=Streptomyces sp. NRRL S-350 TaxID=1463902 RepID=UPI001F298D6B|nr:hypothetical protein [Streptomyces sp. NRRL S-350]